MATRIRAAPRRLVTLSSDVGPAYAAQMKAVLARSVDPGHVIELTSTLPPHAVEESAFVLRAMASGFPAGTVHLVVVDPGVGGARAPVAIECTNGSTLVGPDNGVLSPLAEALGFRRAVRLDPRRIGGGPRVGTTFDGRDLFARAAALLALGRSIARLGPAIAPRVYRLPEPMLLRSGVAGEIVHVDHFGNLISNVPARTVPSTARRLLLQLGRRRIDLPFVSSYAALGAGQLGALGSSFGTLEFAVDRGRAADRLHSRVGTRFALDWGAKTSRPRQSVNSERPKRH